MSMLLFLVNSADLLKASFLGVSVGRDSSDYFNTNQTKTSLILKIVCF